MMIKAEVQSNLLEAACTLAINAFYRWEALHSDNPGPDLAFEDALLDYPDWNLSEALERIRQDPDFIPCMEAWDANPTPGVDDVT